MAWKAKQNLEDIGTEKSIISLVKRSAAVAVLHFKTLQLCLLLTCMRLVWRKCLGLGAQCWIIIHVEGLLVMLGTLPLQLMLLRGMPFESP